MRAGRKITPSGTASTSKSFTLDMKAAWTLEVIEVVSLECVVRKPVR